MTHSDGIKNIAAALSVFRGLMGKIAKTSTNPFLKSKYAALPEILGAITEPLRDAGLVFTQHPEGEGYMTTLLIHVESGEYFSSTYHMAPVKADPQGLGSTITYQRRYALGAILGLNIDDDDDGNAGSGTKNDTRTHAAKPPISTHAFNQALERVKRGDVVVYDRVIGEYSLTTTQQLDLTKAKEGGKA